MFRELNTSEINQVNGGSHGVVSGPRVNIIKSVVDKIAHTPYERTVTRGGKKYTVKYDGNPGW